LKKHKDIKEAFSQLSAASNREKILYLENIVKRVKYLQSKKLTPDETSQIKLTSKRLSSESILPDSVLMDALIDVATIESSLLKGNRISENELLINNYIDDRPDGILVDPTGQILSIDSRVYNNGNIAWYKDGGAPGSGFWWFTDISFRNNSSVEADMYIESTSEPSGWDMFFYVNPGVYYNYSPTYIVPAYTTGYLSDGTPTFTSHDQPYTQSPASEQNTSIIYNLYWDRTWPLANVLLHTYTKSIKNDVTNPDGYVITLPTAKNETSFNVNWTGTDPGIGASGIKLYDVQYRENNGAWINWQSSTTSTSALFTGTRGNYYYFQARATDNVGHIETYPGGNGDTYTYINPLISATVQTSPTGRSFTVDGNTYTSTQIFSWTPSSSHSISTTSPQSGSTGTQYVWSSWSDGGAISHSVSPSGNITYTANFTTQYYLTMAGGTGGNVSPSNGWYNSGQNVGIDATANSGYTFSSWSGSGSGSYSGTTKSTSVTMNGPISETASFTIQSQTKLVTIQTTSPRDSVIVDGERLLSPVIKSWISGSTHTIGILDSAEVTAGERHLWKSWSDGLEKTHNVTILSDTSFTAAIGIQYYLTINGNDPIRYQHVLPPSGWYTKDTTLIITATSSYCPQRFSDWIGSGDGSYTGSENPSTILMQTPIIETANFLSCSFAVSPSRSAFPYSGGRGAFMVSTTGTCCWSVRCMPTWIHILGTWDGTGDGLVEYSIDANDNLLPDSAYIQIVINTFTGKQIVVAAHTVYRAALEILTLSSPNGNEAWDVGSTQNITWSGVNITNVKLEYTIDAGVSWNLITSSTSALTGTEYWTIPNTPSTQCKVRISDANDGIPSDTSDASFTITSACSHTWVPVTNQQYNMSIIAQLKFQNVLSTNANDAVGAFVGSECRGIASPTSPNGLIFLTVTSNSQSGETVTFKSWKSGTCAEMNVTETIQFQNQGEVGTLENPFIFNAGLVTQAINFGIGYTWISVNVNPGAMALNTVFSGLSPSASLNDRIIGQTNFAVYDGTQWIGSLTTIDPKQSYIGRFASAHTLTIIGQPILPSTNPIALGSGWTWVGYLPQIPLAINTALASVTPMPQLNDRFQAQTSFAVFDGTHWIGSLVNLEPGKGFKSRMTNASTLAYSSSSLILSKNATNPMKNLAKSTLSPPNWIPVSNQQYNMSVIGLLKIDGITSSNPNDIVGAFVGQECRGIISPGFNNLLFLTITSNSQSGELVTFKVYDSSRDRVYDIADLLKFVNQAETGTLDNSYNFYLDIPIDNPTIGTDYVFHTGVSNGYIPLTITFNSISSESTQITVVSKDSSLGGSHLPGLTLGNNKVLRRFWTITQSGINSFNATISFSYLNEDLIRAGIAHEESLRVYHGDGIKWHPLNDFTIDSVHNTLTVNNITSFSDFVISGTGDSPLPIQFTAFTVSVYGKNDVQLEWKTISEINNYGFEIERRMINNFPDEWNCITFIAGSGTSNSNHTYSHIDHNLPTGRYVYRIKQIDNDGLFKYYGNVEVDVLSPVTFTVRQNYPNPFNPSTKIDYTLPIHCHVTVEIFDVLGRLVTQLLSKEQDQGRWTTVWNADVETGIYFCRLTAVPIDDASHPLINVKKMLLLK
jgi:hypothetical protein